MSGPRRWRYAVLVVVAVAVGGSGCGTSHRSATRSPGTSTSPPAVAGGAAGEACSSEPPWRPASASSSTVPGSPATAADGDNRAPIVALDPVTGEVRWQVCPGPWAFSDVAVADEGVLV